MSSLGNLASSLVSGSSGTSSGSFLTKLSSGFDMPKVALTALTLFPPTGIIGLNWVAVGNPTIAFMKAISFVFITFMMLYITPFYPSYIPIKIISAIAYFGPWYIFDVLNIVFDKSFDDNGFTLPLPIKEIPANGKLDENGKWKLTLPLASMIIATCGFSILAIKDLLPDSMKTYFTYAAAGGGTMFTGIAAVSGLTSTTVTSGGSTSLNSTTSTQTVAENTTTLGASTTTFGIPSIFGTTSTSPGTTSTSPGTTSTSPGTTSTNSGTTSTGAGTTSINSGTTSTRAGTTSTNSGTTSTGAGTTSTNSGTTSTSVGTTSTNSGTTSTSVGTTSTNSGTTSTSVGTTSTSPGTTTIATNNPFSGLFQDTTPSTTTAVINNPFSGLFQDTTPSTTTRGVINTPFNSLFQDTTPSTTTRGVINNPFNSILQGGGDSLPPLSTFINKLRYKTTQTADEALAFFAILAVIVLGGFATTVFKPTIR